MFKKQVFKATKAPKVDSLKEGSVTPYLSTRKIIKYIHSLDIDVNIKINYESRVLKLPDAQIPEALSLATGDNPQPLFDYLRKLKERD